MKPSVFKMNGEWNVHFLDMCFGEPEVALRSFELWPDAMAFAIDQAEERPKLKVWPVTELMQREGFLNL